MGLFFRAFLLVKSGAYHEALGTWKFRAQLRLELGPVTTFFRLHGHITFAHSVLERERKLVESPSGYANHNVNEDGSD